MAKFHMTIRGREQDGTPAFRRRQHAMATGKAKEHTEQGELFDDGVPRGFLTGKPLYNLAAYYKAQAEREANRTPTRMPNWSGGEDDDAEQ